MRRRQPQLTQREREALDALKARLLHTFNGGVARLLLFGSKARGEAHRDSDVDVLVVLRTNDRHGADRVYDAVSDVAIEYRVPLSVHVYSWREFQRYWRLPTSFMANVAEEAISLL